MDIISQLMNIDEQTQQVIEVDSHMVRQRCIKVDV